MHQTVINYPKCPINIPNGHQIWSTFSNLGPSKVYPNWDFWFEKKPSGNPGLSSKFELSWVVLILKRFLQLVETS
jgi:hypothetical protein